MTQVRIVTDSTCDLPAELVEKYQISVVPLTVFFGEQAYRDGIDITSQEFYQRLVQAKKLPTTSQPSPGDFATAYQPLAAEGYEIISIHLSGELSGTVRSAELGGQMVPGIELEVIDSRTTSIGLGLLVIAAAKAAQAHKSRAEIINLLKGLLDGKSDLRFFLDNLNYVYKGGRIGRASSFLGNLLNIKPILSFQDGIVTPHDKVRGRNRAMERLITMIKEQVGNQQITFAIVHSNAYNHAEQLYQRMAQEFSPAGAFIAELNPVVGTYGGPGVLGIAYCMIEV